MLIKTEVEITPRQIADLMVTVVEGGSHYWCEGIYLRNPAEESARSPLRSPPWYDDESFYQEGLSIEVRERESSSEENVEGSWIIDLKKMEQAFVLMQQYGKPKGFHWRNLMEENWDAETADVWFQLAVFGEVVYG